MDPQKAREIFQAAGSFLYWFDYQGENIGGPEGYDPSFFSGFQERFPSAKRVLDAGCFEGHYSLMLANAYPEVVAVEGRESNYRKCLAVKEVYGLPNLEFRHMDLSQDFRSIGEFDAVFCCGLLYHLPNPAWFLLEMARLTPAIWIRTHLIYMPDSECEGYPGRWFGTVRRDQQTGITRTEFYPTKDSLFRMLRDAGFTDIEVTREFPTKHPRAFNILLSAKKIPA